MISPKVLKLAQALRDMYDMQFGGRAWEDLPDGYRETWIDDAEDLIKKMKETS